MNVSTALILIAGIVAAGTPGETFVETKQDYAQLKTDKNRRQQRAPYEKLIKRLVAASKAKGERADDCAYFAATIAEDLHQASGVAADLEDAVRLNVDVADRFRASSLADDALLRAARLLMSRRGDLEGARGLLQRARKEHAKGDQLAAVDELLRRLPPEPAARAEQNTPPKEKEPARGEASGSERVQEILARLQEQAADAGLAAPLEEVKAISSNADATPAPDAKRVPVTTADIKAEKDRTVVQLPVDGNVQVSTGTAPASAKMPFRFFVDVMPADLAGLARAVKAHKDGRVRDIRVAQFDERTVRVVFELSGEMPGAASYDEAGKRITIVLGKPFETGAPIVAQATIEPAPIAANAHQGHDHADSGAELQPVLTITTPAAAEVKDAGPTLADVKELARELHERPEVSLSAQTGLKVKRVVIDPGHGGDDPGAIGPNGIKEKDVTLQIARKVAAKLRKELKMEVILTRDKDVFIPLEERTAIANAAKADLFISIHCNSNPNRRIHGVETYYLNITDDNYSVRLAARENKTSQRSISDLQFILADLAMKSNVDDSVRLSKLVQANLVGELRERYSTVKDLGVKHALFFVLIGAKMPAILVETSFISNKTEEQRLKSSKYQDRIADGLVQGVRHFVEERQALAR